MSKDAHDNLRPRSHRRRRPLLAALMIAVAVSRSPPAAARAGVTRRPTARAPPKPAAAGADRFASVRACLAKEGITLPSRPSGGATGSTGSTGSTGATGARPGFRGGFKPPEGVSRTKFREALKKCSGGGGFGGRRNFNSAAAKTALTKYATCMRENGVNLPAPNTTGKGPVFNTTGIDRTSTTFKNAEKKCSSDLPGFLGRGGPPAGGRRPPGRRRWTSRAKAAPSPVKAERPRPKAPSTSVEQNRPVREVRAVVFLHTSR